jgi:outer membrane receptor for ferric coprogen and ferric-rhodotorulic acid
VPWIGAYANYSESFNASGSGASKIDGTPVGAAANEGIDVGLKLEFFGGKLAGSIGYYKMQQTERPRAGDRQADIGPGLRGYAATHMATWQAGAANPALPNAARIAQNIVDINSTIGGYTQGRTLNNTVDYTSNLYTTYSFRDGRLKGFAVGGGANFRGKQVIGNVTNRPFNYLYADAYYLVSAHTSYDLRFGKTRVRLQLNAANLLDEDDVVYTTWTFNNALGRELPNAFRYHQPRKVSLTTTFNF